ncbi:MAG TPA: hypothetical protein V6D09_07920 [Leptolyngbyaceae cyanobacterium]
MLFYQEMRWSDRTTLDSKIGRLLSIKDNLDLVASAIAQTPLQAPL